MMADRTTKIKIALGILLFLLAVRWVLGFFPEPLDFAPYTGEGESGELQTVTFTEIRHIMTLKPEGGKAINYYLVKTADGKDGLISTAKLYYDEVLEEGVTVTGMLSELISPNEVTAENEDFFYSQITVTDSFLKEHGSKPAAYRSVCDLPVLNRDFEETTTDNFAALWVSFAAFGVFCWMLAMLLKEYSSGKKAKK